MHRPDYDRAVRRPASATAVTALVVAMLFPLALAATPGDLFLRVKRLQIYEDADAGAVIALERRFWPGYPVEAQWTATVSRIRRDSDGKSVGRIVCDGSGRDMLGGASHERLHLVVRDWLRDPECKVATGEDYVLTATWRFAILGLTKTVSVRTAAEPLAGPPRALQASEHPIAP